ncbi:zinc finger BED domain-containing protein 4-like [Drosophila bipectinata]|uniref:zinc finger BED domain-containing protein 4-like n=1 Tax=Drosophila bipectinata TaxID=42026 RepID=UPI0038B40D65
MKNMYADLTSKLQLILSEVDQCAITMDGWTSRANDGYLTVTVHFINESFELNAAVLSREKLMDPFNHNAENIAASVRNVLSKWNLESKVIAIVTDNASAMIKSLIHEVSTRWNSAFKMVERILATKEFLSPVLSLSRAPDPLTANDIELLEDIQTILAPFDYVTTQCSSSSKVTCSLSVPLTNGLVEGLNDQFGRLKTVNGQQACRFLQDKARIRIFPFEERSTARLATIMDPRYKKEGFRSPFNAEQAAVLLERSLSTNMIAGGDAEEGDPQETAVEPPVTPNAAEPLPKFLFSNIEKKKDQ